MIPRPIALLMLLIAAPASAQPFTGLVSDSAGPLEGARVVVNHGARGATGADGRFTIDAPRAAGRDRVTAAAVGYLTGWLDVFASEPVVDLSFLLEPLAADDPAFEPASPTRCAECHGNYARGWSGAYGFEGSAHARASVNAHVLDVFAGTASGRTDAASCAEVGGSFETVTAPGGASVERCYVGVGLLADLNPQCGHEGQPRCDDAGAPAAARPTAFGDCSGCHTPGAAIEQPAELDLRVAERDAFASAVTCDVCHRIREVLEPDAPGVLEGAVVWRALDPAGEEMGLGPLDDAVYERMRTGYSPLHATSLVCAPCHQDTYAPPGTAARWPRGVPSEQTYEEWLESPYASGERERSCQSCHMPSLADLGVDPDIPIIAAGGPDRDPRELHAHSFDALTDPGSLDDAVDLALEARVEDGEIVASATITNVGVGHAFPSGVTSRHVLLLVSAAREDGSPLAPSGGEIVPHYGGALLVGTIASQDGGTLTLDREADAELVGRELRAFVETDEHRDYVGVGVLREESLEGKGLRATRLLGAFRVTAARGREVDVQGAPSGLDLSGARFAIGDERYLAGTPGFGLCKVNVAADGSPDVPFWRATDILWDNRLAPDESQSSEHRFRLPEDVAGTVTVSARLVYRRTFVGLADERGWAMDDVPAGEARATLSFDGPDAGVSPDGGAGPPASGCGCRAPVGGGAPASVLALVLALALVRRRR